MTELTLEELAELSAELAKSPGWQTEELLSKLYRHRKALLAMARELVRIRAALEFLEVHHAARFSLRSGDEYSLEVNEIAEAASALGCPDPLSPPATPVAELKGGEG